MTGAELRNVRHRLALTQQQLGEKLGVHRVTIAKWEASAAPIPRAIMLAVAGLAPPLASRARRSARERPPARPARASTQRTDRAP